MCQAILEDEACPKLSGDNNKSTKQTRIEKKLTALWNKLKCDPAFLLLQRQAENFGHFLESKADLSSKDVVALQIHLHSTIQRRRSLMDMVGNCFPPFLFTLYWKRKFAHQLLLAVGILFSLVHTLRSNSLRPYH